ncbi:Pycsar system effector family protein [Aliarcobacter butzleri]|uniref:Pycsar system effector family protein n=1 Tax=Aliarcobacter butzleri TaxID=28197 RepID=UPI0021B4E7ED|nr:Pycsar system effector family protein [Aliarcobacter butzleri]MCT7605293.1 DUF5706 domain-containing protein [Aliarcobacter butzleri]
MELNKVDVLKYNISRFDHYFASINFKSSFLILANITILGFLISNSNHVSKFSLIIVSLISVLTVTFVLLAIKPFLKTYKGKDSIIYFGDIANQEDDFDNKIDNLTLELYINDLRKQNIILAQGLKYKFDMLNIATIFFIINLIVYVLILIT